MSYISLDRAMWRCLAHAARGELVLWACPSWASAEATLDAYGDLINAEPGVARLVKRVCNRRSEARIEFVDRGRIIFISWRGNGGRGFAPNVLVVDGASDHDEQKLALAIAMTPIVYRVGGKAW
ncbi:hypothetical protein SEA_OHSHAGHENNESSY_91 [Mycobacterium phage OhShagHennessy]|uniref:Uncharacterized protein n=1 Tax=Mycobacterium phage OhShagHennessy TaxID=2801895 RepID=A0A7U0GCQ8_9CAUD|nr:hypothetical protein KNV76_gp091 [Mycobacterium phage OhShagHennessy]QQV92794.1 hypothetical protein SEA_OHSHAGHENNESSY_91 [Mycobacterium phage OhShagHennessy]